MPILVPANQISSSESGPDSPSVMYDLTEIDGQQFVKVKVVINHGRAFLSNGSFANLDWLV